MPQRVLSIIEQARTAVRAVFCLRAERFATGMLFLGVAAIAAGQMPAPPPGPLDPAVGATLQLPALNRLREEFIWTAGDAAAHDPALQAKVRGQDDKTEPHFFRAHFRVNAPVPKEATMYLAGPRAAAVWINGQQVLDATDDGTRPKNLTVITADVAKALHTGDNVIAMRVVRGHSSLHTGASPTINQVTYGEVLAVKIVPRGIAVDATPLVISDTRWRSSLKADEGWQQPGFDDAAWPQVESLGVLGSKRDFLQWSADAGLYAWPGYTGISSDLRVFPVQPLPVHAEGCGAGLRIERTCTITYDFGREISARVRLISDGDATQLVQASYGESSEEAEKDKGYLGTRAITVAPHGTAFGAKSAFHFVKLTLPEGSRWRAIDAEAITYPVQYKGRFESNDEELNRIWQTAAYTARLCMQEGIWDGVKRDRGRWMGDLDVTGRAITAVFGERALMERTMAEIIGPAPVTRPINTIAGYSALWITGEANFYRHSGDLTYLRSLEPQLLTLLQVMDGELSADGSFTNPDRHKVFVDWSEGFSSDTPEARAATELEYAAAYRDAAYLLKEIGNEVQARKRTGAAELLEANAQAHLLTPSTKTFGDRWQTNAWAVISGVANDEQRQAIWRDVLAHVNDAGDAKSPVITPFQGYYVLAAMAELGHREEALAWMRRYWGGMLRLGATSFWEAYDPRWPAEDFHAHLEADGKAGYYVSLAHGWASGPAVWLPEEILGIMPSAAGFRELTIAPELAGLKWARGAEPTPRGSIAVDVAPTTLTVTLPAGTNARVRLPFATTDRSRVRMNGAPLPASEEDSGRLVVILAHAGSYRFALR